MPGETNARVWLRANGFVYVADAIDRIMQMWQETGKKTRRDWWEALGGTPKGLPKTVEGFTFPIIAAVRQRRKLPPVDGALEVPPGVTVPEEVPQARWAHKQKKSRRSPSAKKASAPRKPSSSAPKKRTKTRRPGC